ncbi:putative O-succinylbenzoic acid--CoA ligase MenE [Nocardioides baekrokdamisoli]|uniref:Putative O-succinylbenzoic acid--CoA ligase MenE n=1 Tax=Nocardioides baekrokdamisoli TaxID=1804624 RepID=A0A3G9IVX4_9ACTN|nr:AMP-binding protein [Nocardioides baekrokdamisoli]BBH17841.1 putative O-succinylbenzoic acid--CoA ligase MenE [Nocardioides baekrokdamisoli]
MVNASERDGVVERIQAVRAWWESDDPAPWIAETSGSTGRPKQVQLSRDAVRAAVAASAQRIGATGRWALAVPPEFVGGFNVIVRSLAAGHVPVVVEDLDFSRVDADFLSLVPTQLHRVLDAPDDLRRFHTILVGGGPSDAAVRTRAKEAGLNVVATYGMAETCGGVVYDGRPLEGVRIGIGDDARIRISGPTLFDGYAGIPGSGPDEGWFTTADAGSFTDGVLAVFGRVDDMVITGGVKVATPAVAARLRQHQWVRTAEVLGVPDPEWGQRVVAFVVGEVDLDDARDWVGETLPRSWAPRQIVPLTRMPLLDNGKVDRQALLELA